MKKILFFILFISFTFSCHKKPEEQTAGNIILMIGDGMGLSQVYAGMTANHGKLFLEKCTNIGLQKTYSANSYVTDSGAAATALATGIKTKNGMIATDTAGQFVKTILEYAETNGLATGLVVVCPITHATPAAFIAHQPDRNDYEKIAMDFLKTEIDIFIGGGKDHFARRPDSLNLLDSLANRGYQVIMDYKEIKNTGQKIACFTADMSNPPAAMGRGDLLPEATKEAIQFLDSLGTGFFLMVEGSQIDGAAHANITGGVISEMIDFDKAIGVALDFAEKHGNTLVVITGDHETGGMSINGGDPVSGTVEASFTSEDHTAVMVPVFAYGPGAEKFSGIYENTDIFFKMMNVFGFKTE